MIFDLLELDGSSTLELPYVERRALLEKLELDEANWQTPSYHVGDGQALLDAAARAASRRRRQAAGQPPIDPDGARGMDQGAQLAPRGVRDRRVHARRGRDAADGSARSGRVLRLDSGRGAEPRAPALLVYAGGVGSGFTNDEVERLTRMLTARSRDTTPFVGAPKRPRGALLRARARARSSSASGRRRAPCASPPTRACVRTRSSRGRPGAIGSRR